jgi:hypothetical protein
LKGPQVWRTFAAQQPCGQQNCQRKGYYNDAQQPHPEGSTRRGSRWIFVPPDRFWRKKLRVAGFLNGFLEMMITFEVVTSGSCTSQRRAGKLQVHEGPTRRCSKSCTMEKPAMSHQINRRKMLKASSLAGAGFWVTSQVDWVQV